MFLNKNKKGFTILEVVIAIGIISIGLLGVLSLVLQNSQVQINNKNHLVGSMLAQEGIELVRNIKDHNYMITGNSWNTDISDWDDTFIIDHRGRALMDDTPNSIDDASTRLYFDSTAGLYTHESTGNANTNFSRLITIMNDGPESTVVNCQVRWYDQGREKAYIAETEMHDWR